MTHTYTTNDLNLGAYLLGKHYPLIRGDKTTYTTHTGVNKPSVVFTFRLPRPVEVILDEWELSDEKHYHECRLTLKRIVSKLLKSPNNSINVREE